MNTATLTAEHAAPRKRQLSLLSGSFALFNSLRIGGRVNRAVAVNAFNALMCGAIAASIAWLRWMQPNAIFPTFF